MGENLNIFGKNQEEIGSLDKNLVLRTQGRVYIRYGKKYIELLDSQGNINVKVPKVIQKANSELEIKNDGFYLIDDNLYAYSGGKIIQLSGIEGSFINYAIEQDLSQEQLNIAQKNIGLKHSTIQEALNSVKEGIVFIGDSIYYINNGQYSKISSNSSQENNLNHPLKEINSSNLEKYPPYAKSILAFVNGYWTYLEFPEQEEILNLVNPLKSINKQAIQEMETAQEGDEILNNIPTNIDNICISRKTNKWKYIEMTTKENFDSLAFISANYNSTDKKIYFYNNKNEVIEVIDATDFIKDGMVSEVIIRNGNLIITFNTDSGKEDIVIPLTDIFDPSNYYTKTEVDTALAKKVNISDYNTKIEEIETAISEKADKSAIIDMATKTWVEDQHYLTQHQSLANYYTKSETNTAISNATNDMATKTWVNNQGFLKQHQSLANYYTKTEVDDKISQAASDTMPIGSIIMFGKPQNQIPSGWHICDGTSGTPDLRGRFIVGASGESDTDYNRGTTGGIQKNIINSSDIPIPSHKHSFEDFYVFETWDPLAEARDDGKLVGYSTLPGSKGGLTRISSTSTYYGNYQSDKNNDTFAWYLHNTRDTLNDYGEKIDSIENQLELDNRPPYYALYYIMKIS